MKTFLKQYEGISYLPESATNYDNLLEELYWIAKTTVRDFFLKIIVKVDSTVIVMM